MKFSSKKDVLFSSIILGTNIFLIAIVFYVVFTKELQSEDYWGFAVILAVILLLFWLFYGTNYELTKDALIYRCGPINGKISTSRIKEIVKGKTLWVGFRPATSRNGLIIKYDKYNEIYISPKTNETFIKKILELNKDIIVKEDY